MPNRILRDAILTSEAVCSLSWADEVFYRRLMSIVDDYGRHEANPQLLRSKCYPLQTDAVRVADITRSMAACQKAGVIVLYEANGKQYLQVSKFGQQQRTPSKCPPPPTSDSNCEQAPANAHLVVFGDGDEDVKKGARKRAAFDPSEIELPSWLDRALWQRWCADRKARGKPVTEEGAKSQVRKLEQYRTEGHSPESVVDHSIAGGYQGLFAPARSREQTAAQTATSTEADRTAEYLRSQAMTPEQREAANEARERAMAAIKIVRTA